MLNNNGKLGCADDLVVSDEEFAEIQRRHFAKKKDPAAAQRAKKSLKSCLEAIAAFRDIAGVQPVATATAADCERFQTRIPTLPKDWLRRHDAKSRAPPYSPTAAIKWWRELQAAFERANRQAGKKCVRGVVDESRLLTENPWLQFTWIEGVHRPIRQFDDEELLSLLDYLETHWSGVPVSAALARVLLWSWGRKQEILGLKWDSLRNCGDEIDFETVGKRGVEKWFRIPAGLYEELLGFKTASPFVFADHNRQLRAHHRARSRPTDAELVSRKFNPDNVGKWFERRLSEWSKTLTRGRATIHVFRKTAFQYARRVEDINQQVARDARIGVGVMMKHYVKETDPERREASNRTFYRIAASLDCETARRYGRPIAVKSREELESELHRAVSRKDYPRVTQLSAELASRRAP